MKSIGLSAANTSNFHILVYDPQADLLIAQEQYLLLLADSFSKHSNWSERVKTYFTDKITQMLTDHTDRAEDGCADDGVFAADVVSGTTCELVDQILDNVSSWALKYNVNTCVVKQNKFANKVTNQMTKLGKKLKRKAKC